MNTQISGYIKRLLTAEGSQNPHCDMTSSSVHPMHVPIPTDLHHQLKALAAAYHRDANCIAGDLLTIVLTEALSTLPEEVRNQLDKARKEYERDQSTKLMESVSYDAGGT